MQTLRLILAASGLALLLPVAAYAQSADEFDSMTPEQRREYVQGLSDAERKAWREQRREQWDSMSDQERAAAREKYRERREQRRETWNNMSAEERAAARQQLHQRRDGARGQRKEHRNRQK